MTLILMKCGVGVKFWVLIFKSTPKQSLNIMDLKVAPCPTNILPNFQHLNSARSSKCPTSPQNCSSSQDRPALWAPIPPVRPNPWPLQELKLSPQRVRFASKAAALLFAWAAKAVVEAISVVVGGGWSWLSAGRMSKGKGKFCKKVVKRCEK